MGVEQGIPGQKNKGRGLEVTVWNGGSHGIFRAAREPVARDEAENTSQVLGASLVSSDALRVEGY